MLRTRHLWVAKMGRFPSPLYRNPGNYVAYYWTRSGKPKKAVFRILDTEKFFLSIVDFIAISGPFLLNDSEESDPS